MVIETCPHCRASVPCRDHATPPSSWQSRVVYALVRARMRPYAHAPIDVAWVRKQMGQPRPVRRWMARATGAVYHDRPAASGWPGGEVLHAPGGAPDAGTLLYLHGGGYIACSPETHRSLVGSLVRRLGVTAWVPRYRLAPEHPYPAALEDAFAAYQFLLSQPTVAPDRLLVAGDSAGGGLALALMQRVRDRGLPMPAGIVTFSPWTDLAVTGASVEANSARCAMFAADTIRRAAPLYAGTHDPQTPGISPLYGSFAGLPPLLIQASTEEVLRDDAIRVADRARAQGVDVTLQLWTHVPHVWQFFSAVMPEAEAALRAVEGFAARVLPRTS
ncbi:MAG: hypothetical protein RLZZ621_2054 [Gemmatimonadota bacterium]